MADRLKELVYCCNLVKNSPIKDRNRYLEAARLLGKYIDENRDVLTELLLLRRIHSYTENHSINVALYSLVMALYMELSAQETQDLVVGSLLHDMGKAIVNTAILDKPCRLSEEEFLLIKMHPWYGITITSSVEGMNNNIVSVIQEHHEKLDGSGYPSGIKGVSFLAQIATVADMFDAITSKRSYHEALSAKQALAILQADVRHGKLNSEVVTILRNAL